MLNRHSSVFIADETHYFDDLRPRVGGARPLEPDERAKAELYFCALADGFYGFAPTDRTQVAQEDQPDRPWTCVATADDMFAAFCRARAAERGKAIWGEKTPRHVFRGAEILSAFPQARLIATVRDPRAVVASYRDWRKTKTEANARNDEVVRREIGRIRASYSLTTNALLWNSAIRAAERLQKQFGAQRVRLLRFETLVRSPEPTLRELCAWLNIDFASSMLRIGVVNSTHLAEGMEGVQASVVDRWQQQLNSDEISYIQWLTRNPALRHGYKPLGVPLRAHFVARQLLASSTQFVRALMANRGRFGSLRQSVFTRLRYALDRD
jgi:hypothetical protein